MRNEATVARLVGELNVDAMERALDALVARQDSGRFEKVDLSSLAVEQRQSEVERLLRLESEPGIRATLLCLGPREHVLILTMQRIAGDWSSDGIVWRQLANLYGTLSRGETPVLPYSGDARPGLARQDLVLNPDLTGALRDLGQRTGTTLFTIFAAASNTLRYRYTGREDIVWGYSAQVLRTELSGDMTFRQLLASVQMGAKNNSSGAPSSEVTLHWRDRDPLQPFLDLEGLVVEPMLTGGSASQFDRTLIATDCGNEIRLEIQDSMDLFEEAGVAQMLGHYRTLLESAAQNPDQCIAELPLLTPAEQSTLAEWNRTELPYPKDRLLHELIERQVESTPDAVAVVFEGRQLTFRQLDDRANALGRHLRNMGVGPNVLVGVCVERSAEMLIGLLGILKSGGAYVPLDPAFPSARLAFMLENSRPRVLLTLQRMQKELPPHQAEVVCLDALPAESGSADEWPTPNRCEPTDLAYVLYTSGSTGQPKGVPVSNRALVNFLSAMRREPGLLASDTLLAVTTLSFDIAGLELFLPLFTGARVVIASQEAAADGAQLCSLMKQHGVTAMQATPATWRLLLEAGWTGSHNLKILCGGEAWPPSLAAELLPRCNSLWNMYGPTETTIWSSVARVESNKPVLIGRPIANTTFHVLDHNEQLVPIGVPGELYIGGDSVAEGYLNRPDLTKERFVSDPFGEQPGARLYRTGDVVRRTSDGLLEFLHRCDQQVKIRGFRIELGEIEAALKQHPGVAECVTVVRQDAMGEDRLQAYVVPSGVPSSPQPALGASDLRHFVKQKLPEYMIPAGFTVIERFPLTPNGKIDRKALKTAQYPPSAAEAGQPSVPPQTLLELHLLKIWQRTLELETIGGQDNFFEIGGHSLLAVRLIEEINQAFHVSLTTQIFFLNPTIEGVAQVLIEGNYAAPGPHLIPLHPGRSPGAIFFLDASMAVCRLAQLLDHGPAVFATEAPLPSAAYRAAVLNETSALPRVQDMAAAHVNLILSQEFSGPCLLAGHSFNGLLAVEVAHQLRRHGKNVEMLLLLDSLLMTAPLWYRIKVLSRARAHAALARRFRGLALIAERVTARIFPGFREETAVNSAFERDDRPLIELPSQIREKIYENGQNYELRPLESQAVLCLAQDQHDPMSRLCQTLANIKRISRMFTRGVEIVRTPGGHISMLDDPHILVLAQKLNECLAQHSYSFPVNDEDRTVHANTWSNPVEEPVTGIRHMRL